MDDELRVIISGGGTGGHIFPAISIANALKAKNPNVKILFVGALGRMEMQRVPAAGYEIKGLPICGFDRKHLLKNVAVLFKVWKSQLNGEENHPPVPSADWCRCRRLCFRSNAQ
jgi:UDP-N-acetylglucosamine--N-acetylmuramyl-(pentapeptide) pyrophosphoryl-undecaprenol N-acetylglucosamine transferase